MGAARNPRTAGGIADSARRRSVRRLRAVAVPSCFRFLRWDLSARTRVACLELPGIDPVSGIRAWKYRDVHFRPVDDRRVQESTRFIDAEELEHCADARRRRPGCLDGRRIELVSLRSVEAQTGSLATDGVSVATRGAADLLPLDRRSAAAENSVAGYGVCQQQIHAGIPPAAGASAADAAGAGVGGNRHHHIRAR